MLYPSIEELTKYGENRYALVIAVAKRAREIVEDAENAGMALEENPVSTAINDIYTKKVLIEDPYRGQN